MTLASLLDKYKDYPYNEEWQKSNYKVNFDMDYSDNHIRFFSDEVLNFKLDYKEGKPCIRFFLKTEKMTTLIINLDNLDLEKELEKREEKGKYIYTLKTDNFNLVLGVYSPCDF